MKLMETPRPLQMASSTTMQPTPQTIIQELKVEEAQTLVTLILAILEIIQNVDQATVLFEIMEASEAVMGKVLEVIQ